MVRPIRLVAGGCALAISLAGPALAQGADDDVRKEIEALKRGQQAMQQQIEEIKKLLLARPAAPAPPPALNVGGKVFDLGANPIRGTNSAGLTLIEFSDYQ